MADENGVDPDAEVKTTDITQIFMRGGLKVDALGDVKRKVKGAATKGNWITVQDLNGNDVDLNAPDVMAYIVLHDMVLQRQEIRRPNPAANAPKPPGDFKPVVMQD